MKEKGSILILGLLMMAVLLMIGGVFLSLTGVNYSMLISDSDVLKAYWIAQAGVKKAIYDLKDDFSKHIHTLNKYQFSDGEYELSISSLDTTGIRNILCVSIGAYKNSSYAMAIEMQLDTPTDYLYFFDGNGEFGNIDDVAPVVLGGPIHSNAHLRFTPWHNYIYVIKPVNIKGPAISAAGLVTRSEAYNPGTDGVGYQSPVMIGETQASFDNNFFYTGTVPDKSLSYSTWTFKVFKRPNTIGYDPTITYPEDFTNSDFAMSSVNPSPVEIFPTENTKLGLLNDGYHNGYRIHIPTIRKVTAGTKYKASEYADLPLQGESEWEATISSYYKDYIDERWYIRAIKHEDSYGNKYYTVSNSAGLTVKEFVNDALRRKFVLGKGDGSNKQFSIPDYYPKVEEIDRQNSSGSLNYFNYFPSRNRIKNVYINGNNVKSLPGFTFGAYYIDSANVYYTTNFLPANSKIAFDFVPSNNQKNIKVKFYPTIPCMIGTGNGTTRTFEYYPTTITDVLVNAIPTTDYTFANADHSVTAVTLNSINSPTNTIFQASSANDQNFANLFKSDPLQIYKDGILIYDFDATPSVNDGTISNIDYTNGKVTFTASQSGSITAKYIARAIIFNNAPPAPSQSSPWTNIGVKYTGYVTIAEGYGSSDSNPISGRAREFNFITQYFGNVITEITVDGIDAYYVVSDRYHRGNTQEWGFISFKNPPPANSSIGIDYVKNVYLINRNEPKINNEDLGADNELSTDHPPLYNNKTWGVYRWYDYEIINNQIKFQSSGASDVGYGLPALGPEPSPIPVQNSFVCVDTPIKAVEIDLSKVIPVPAQGVIFSEVPVIVKGNPKEPITIVCLGDVYVQSINDKFSDDSDQASPVGIISTGAIWVDHNAAFKLDINHLDWSTNYDVIMNKVALYTTRGFFYTGGRQYRNRMRFIGSICNLANDFGSKVKETDSSSFYYADVGKLVRAYAYRYLADDGVTQIIGSAQLYPISFRADKTTETNSNHRPPPHMPVYIQIKYFKGIVSTDAKKFIESIKSYFISGQKIPVEIYNELIAKL